MNETAVSAKGTRLNKRGLETRQALLATAVECLADGGPESASASLIAREAGVTWGTVQHQFGDVDGLWAALLEHLLRDGSVAVLPVPASTDVGERMEAVVGQLWTAMDLPTVRAIHHLRLALPRQRDELEAAYPLTAAAIGRWDVAWTATMEQAFAGLDLDPVRLSRVRSLLPGAMRGLHNEQYLSTYTDSAEARRGLVDALSSYLENR
ncbi:TetR/AcrR family transcriptional regulator [Nocardioides marmoriginsengisoli]|uniref:TetR/AcrR family transcriptional regulator n=1 Tax=Nocardioides marmoriginsengisoli TaxID=661483 RepID=A0A3N0CLH8_9ACTN|nr:TetR/AcrR family transcriptional regulator [Nocardioides marmoriginsengisoli]RNL64324.1 TetR/AcrR family transcriptional regulator [Nocardioides marmoriginsengisoli]